MTPPTDPTPSEGTADSDIDQLIDDIPAYSDNAKKMKAALKAAIDHKIAQEANKARLIKHNICAWVAERECDCGATQDAFNNLELEERYATDPTDLGDLGASARSDKAKRPPVSKSLTELVSSGELSSYKDRAHLYDLIMDAPCYVTFFTGQDGQGASLRQTMIVPRKHHMDGRLYKMANRMAKKLGASSWCVFKPVGPAFDVEYGRYGDESRLDFLEATDELWADDEVNDLEASDE